MIIGLLALALGALIGWLLASRQSAGARQTVEALRLQLDEVVKERDCNRDAATRLAALEAAQAERDKGFEARIKELVEAKEALSVQFAEISNKLLAEAQETFLKRADQRFRQSEESAGQNLKALLQPVHERLERYETTVQKVEAERRDAFGLLSGQIEAMRTGTERVSAEAAKLVNALRNAPKARGRWGEQQLRNVLETCGLSEHCDFATEVSVGDGEGGRLRPDVVVRVPGGQSLVIDAKVSLNAYQDAFEAVDEAERSVHLATHATSIKNHVNALGNKAYWGQFEDAPDYVVMFIPGEHFLTAALEQDATLWDYAFDKRVLLATPTNLIAIARTVAAVWRQETLAKEARLIGDLAKELHSRLATVAQHMERVGRNLSTATGAYNQMVGSFESQVLTQARRFETLGAGSAKKLDTPPMVEAIPRPLTKAGNGEGTLIHKILGNDPVLPEE
jgi:DNA recombination protein RmuC